MQAVRDGELRTATSTFTQLLNTAPFSGSRSVSLYVHRDRTDSKGRGALDGHLGFHTALEHCALLRFKFSVALRPQRPYGLLGTGSPVRLPRLSHSSRALNTTITGSQFGLAIPKY